MFELFKKNNQIWHSGFIVTVTVGKKFIIVQFIGPVNRT